MQFGAYTFVETRRDPRTGEPIDVDKSFADVLEQIELADRVGLDVFGLGEHHRADYAVSAPAVALAAAAARTKRIRLTSAVTVLSSDDPVRVYQRSTPDAPGHDATLSPPNRQQLPCSLGNVCIVSRTFGSYPRQAFSDTPDVTPPWRRI
jgi:Luciferase-like monooxygenase